MAIITKITTQQKNQDRYNVFMDYGKGEEFAFSVDSDVLIKFQLKKGLELDDFSFLEIQYQDDIRKAYHHAIQYLSKRMRSEKEITDYLAKKEIDEPIINEVLHKLTSQKYIDDWEYAHAFVRTQVNTTDKGPDLIWLELKDRGIKEDFARQALQDFPYELQVEKASILAKKFFEKNTKDSERIVKQKLEGLLLRKGYPFEIIQIAVNESELDKDDDAEMDAIRFQGEKVYRKYCHLSGFEFKQKMKQALYRKGFSMDLIEKFLAEKEES
ncbi:recombination regulator RecX [Bacillus sp. UNC438CL73TsuS30]|uniref:recombination regulator RecX n=1 Tax=Bacillus sp. UNC438CL73TsuS30 TaxID=1340434 RepID=UPI00047D16BE|nr:recombination regulator RecX [Bacillus sp. UNC438CL73TsuS30]